MNTLENRGNVKDEETGRERKKKERCQTGKNLQYQQIQL